MRRLRYSVAASLDGFIAGPEGQYDWIVHDPAIDFAAMFAEFDAFVMGRRTFDLVRSQQGKPMGDAEVMVASRTLRPSDHPGVTIVADDVPAAVSAWKERPGKDIWLFGGGVLFRTLLDARLVDTVEIGLMPVLLGEGIPLVSPGRQSPPLRLFRHERLPTGIVRLAYEFDYGRVG